MLYHSNFTKTVSKKTYKEKLEKYILELGILQRKFREQKIPFILLIDGWEASGKGTMVNNLIFSLDPRGYIVYPEKDEETNDEEYHRHYLWRFWQKLPEKGRISIFLRGWYQKLNKDFIKKEKESSLLFEIINFEKLLVNEKYLLIKIFLHISQEEQKNRLLKLKKKSSTNWKADKKDWKQNKNYKKFQKCFDSILKKTNLSTSWHVIESHAEKYATLNVYAKIITDMRNFLNKQTKRDEKVSFIKSDRSIFKNRDMTKTLTREEYKEKLKYYQQEIRDLEYKIYKKRIPVIIMYEGWDAAGKGGNIKRLTENLDPRGYEVVPIAAPNETERLHHYLWRFWRKIPKDGHIVIFDRTWYGRVTVERIEGLCTEEQWIRAYREINETELLLANHGTIIIKIFLNITKDEQLKRFEARQKLEVKKWKITDEDWRNREKWDVYETALTDMMNNTDNKHAKWHIIEANSKLFARIKVLKTVCETIKNKI